jgi:hypothetical protein
MNVEWRNPKYASTKELVIECEINHPEYGWVPFACCPNDTSASFDTAALFSAMEASGTVAPADPLPIGISISIGQ